jgi:hypothetical protein|tara:strand:+ start:741 stop:911 length:171 start_codon:yes stop_codon:yes gene_type:complete
MSIGPESEEEDSVYEECTNFIKFCKSWDIEVTSEALAHVWTQYQLVDDDDDDDYDE